LFALLGAACSGRQASSGSMLVSGNLSQTQLLVTNAEAKKTSSQLTSLLNSQGAAAAQSLASLVLCKQDDPKVYLVIGEERRHIVDWDTYLNLGFTQEQIIPCGAMADYAEGAPITRLLKGSGDPVYWMEAGRRRHIPNMETFFALGLQVEDIATVPDDVLSSWPLGTALPSVTTSLVLCKQDDPKVYLVIGEERLHIVDWDTFLSLGFRQEQIVPCGAMADYAEGAPITRLLKGSGDPVYWMEAGRRRHIPNMQTFFALGFQVKDIATVPDDVLSSWPLGTALPSAQGS